MASEVSRRFGRRRIRDASLGAAVRLALALLLAAAGLAAAAPAAPALLLVSGEESEAASAAVNTAPPTLSGTPAPGQVLTCSTGAWSGSPSSFSYAWLRNGVPISGQAGSSYAVQGADAGSALSCSVTARNDGGEYSIGGLATGSYEVAFEAGSTDFLSQAFNEKPVTATGDPVAVTAGTTTGAINARLQRGGRISGRVTSAATGIPLREIEVCVRGEVVHFDGCAYTSSSGEYAVTGLPADSYTVEFETFEAGYNYAPQYYSGKPKSTEATPVQVAGGATVAGVNAALTEGGQIKGTVTVSGGGPLEGAEVCASDECATTDSSGRYTISNLASGKYTVSFSPLPEQDQFEELFGSESEELKPPEQSPYLPQYYKDKAEYFEAEEVQVEAGSEASGIDAALETGGFIDGTVVAKEGGLPIGKVLVCAQSNEESSRCTITAPNGEYRIEGLAESSYEVEFVTDAAFYNHSNYASQVYKDKEISETPDPVAVKKNVGTGGINGELLQGAQITGKIVAASSRTPLVNAEACAVSVPVSILFINCATTNGAGEYTIRGLSSGSYAVVFVGPEDSEYLYGIYNNEPSLTDADKIAVTAEHRYPGINAALQLGGRITGRVTAADTGAPIAGVSVCADSVTVTELVGNSCTRTRSPGAAGTATSPALSVPAAPGGGSQPVSAALALGKSVSINTKTGAVTFTLVTLAPGGLSWSFVFRNADVGFVDSAGAGPHPPAGASGVKCKAGLVRHAGRCVHLTVAFASGSRSVGVGTFKVTLQPSKKALKALKSGHTLHLSGSFLYTPAAGGQHLTRTASVVVRLPRPRRAKH